MFDDTNPNQQLPGAAPADTSSPAPPKTAPESTETAPMQKEPMAESMPSTPKPTSTSGELEDIFSGADTGPVPGPAASSAPPVSSITPEEMQVVPDAGGGAVIKKILIIVIIIVSVAGIGLGGYWYYNNLLKSRLENETIQPEKINPIPSQPKDEAVPEPEAIPAVTEPETPPPAPVTEPEVVPEEPAETDPNAGDNDGDGLSNREERLLGTNPDKTDSDNDGLFDKEEVIKYKTDPLNNDTDGDTYSDGDEVKAGYNPNGPGKLPLDVLEEINKK